MACRSAPSPAGSGEGGRAGSPTSRIGSSTSRELGGAGSEACALDELDDHEDDDDDDDDHGFGAEAGWADDADGRARGAFCLPPPSLPSEMSFSIA